MQKIIMEIVPYLLYLTVNHVNKNSILVERSRNFSEM